MTCSCECCLRMRTSMFTTRRHVSKLMWLVSKMQELQVILNRFEYLTITNSSSLTVSGVQLSFQKLRGKLAYPKLTITPNLAKCLTFCQLVLLASACAAMKPMCDTSTRKSSLTNEKHNCSDVQQQVMYITYIVFALTASLYFF